jgi:hypothetical protein
VDVVAQSDLSMDFTAQVRPEDAGKTVGPLNVPVFLPITMARQPGMLLLLDNAVSPDGVIAIGIPR